MSSKAPAIEPLVGDHKKLGLSEDDLKRMYRYMAMSRLLDERMMRLQRQGRIGFFGTASGEEAAVVGSGAVLRADDWVFPALRQGAAALMLGMPLEIFIAQCIGNSLDVAKGRQMPVHYSYKPVNFVSWSSCISTQLPHAVGMAYAAKLKGDSVFAMAYMGDGGTSEGDFHVALNFAGVYKSPVVFFCQNNQWAISVPIDQQTASDSIAVKANAYGFEGVRIDGNDIFQVYEATKAAADKALAGDGPTLVEAVTYRMGSHSSSDDPTRYRPEGEMEMWQTKDPILRLRHYMEGKKLWDESAEEAMMKELNDEVSEAIKIAEAAPPLTSDSLFTDVYANPPVQLQRQAKAHSESK